MQFVSITWLGFIWLTVGLYWLTPRAYRLHLLAGITLCFLIAVSWKSAVILAVFALVSHLVGNRRQIQTRELLTTIVGLIAVLVWFRMGVPYDADDLVRTALVPLGLSFYTFRCIHFLIERYSGRQRPCTGAELVGYLFFLPTIPAGPIHRIDDYLRDLMRQRFDPALLSEGAERIIYGYAKIAILGNFLVQGQMGAWINSLPNQDGPVVLYLEVVRNGLNIYLQFSGHSDVAIGFARLLGFRVIENFNWPYLQSNISAFWRSWHISLSRWCRAYIYDPVVGLTRLPALGAFATMIVIGLWHEISLRYLYWGAYHGVGIIAWQLWRAHLYPHMPTVPARFKWLSETLAVLLTVHFVWFSFLLLTTDGPLETAAIISTIMFGWL